MAQNPDSAGILDPSAGAAQVGSGSVQESIEAFLLPVLKADSCKARQESQAFEDVACRTAETGRLIPFPLIPISSSEQFMSAGREDMDVRMLGSGRPFVFEVANQRLAPPSPVSALFVSQAMSAHAQPRSQRDLRSVGPSREPRRRTAPRLRRPSQLRTLASPSGHFSPSPRRSETSW